MKKFYIQWHLSDKCNLKCKHCYIDERRKDLSLEEMKAGIANILNPLSNWVEEIDICLSGGEPFLYPHLEDVILYLKKWKKVKKIMFTSNGTIVDKKLFNRVGKYIDNIQISLEGGQKINDEIRGKGVYDIIKNNIPFYKKMGCKIAINMTLHKLNHKDIHPVIDFCLLNNVDIFVLTRLVPVGNKDGLQKMMLSKVQVKNIYEDMYRLSKTYKNKLIFSFDKPLWNIIDNRSGFACSAGFSGIAILSDGTILPCRRLELPLGNFLVDDFVDIWIKSPILKQLRDRKAISECGNCKCLEKCGGCRAIAYEESGHITGKDPQCFLKLL